MGTREYDDLPPARTPILVLPPLPVPRDDVVEEKFGTSDLVLTMNMTKPIISITIINNMTNITEFHWRPCS